MKKIILILFCCSSLFAGFSSTAVLGLALKHRDINDTHAAHEQEFDNIRKILGKVLLTQANMAFWLNNEAELLFLTMQAEGDRDIMANTNKVLKEFLK